MAEDKIYYPEVIEDSPFPEQVGEVSFDSSQKSSQDIYSQESIKDQPLPDRRIAYEVIGSALNTKSRKIQAEFQFTQTGGLVIGGYENGVSGEVKISPNGIVARNDSGVTTFVLDGTTGDAVFSGTIQAGTLVAGLMVVGNNTWVIDGDPDFPRIILYNDNKPSIILGFV